MSYILDALKKSELERNGGEPPEWNQAEITETPIEPTAKLRNVKILLLVLVPILLGLIYWVFFSGSDEPIDTSSLESDQAAVTEKSVTSAPPVDIKKSQTKKIEKLNLRDFAAAQGITTKPRDVDSTASLSSVIFSDVPLTIETIPKHKIKKISANFKRTAVVSVFELPEAMQGSLPTLLFSGHVYSSDSKKRHIMINAQKVREGDSVAVGVLLDKITLSGAEFSYKKRRFSLNALQDWEGKR